MNSCLMDKKWVDLHNHLGERSIQELTQEALDYGMSAIAITDHDRVSLNKSFVTETLEVLPGSEISVKYIDRSGKKNVLHVIALFFDSVPEEIAQKISRINNDDYIEAMIRTLNRVEIPVTLQEVKEEYANTPIIERRNLVDYLVKTGYAASSDEALDRWLGKYSPYYINPVDYIHYMSLETCVRLVTKSGGIPILAHPLLYFKNDRSELEHLLKVFRSLTDAPLGLEAYYKKYSPAEMEELRLLSVKYDLLPSAAGDGHKKGSLFMNGDPALLEVIRTEVSRFYHN